MAIKKVRCVRKVTNAKRVDVGKTVSKWHVQLECGHDLTKPYYENVGTGRVAPEPVSIGCKECAKKLADRQTTIFDRIAAQ